MRHIPESQHPAALRRKDDPILYVRVRGDLPANNPAKVYCDKICPTPPVMTTVLKTRIYNSSATVPETREKGSEVQKLEKPHDIPYNGVTTQPKDG